MSKAVKLATCIDLLERTLELVELNDDRGENSARNEMIRSLLEEVVKELSEVKDGV